MNAVAAEAALTLRDERALVTPEGVALRLALAPVSERVAALLLDLAIMIGVLIAFSLIVALLLIGSARLDTGPVMAAIWLLGAFALRNFWFIHFEAGPRAATPGKRALGLRVAARDGGRLRVDAVFARNLMRELEFFLPLSLLGAARFSEGVDEWTALAGLVWTLAFLLLPLVNHDRLRLGDVVAGTWVIRAPRPSLGADLARAERAARDFTDAELETYGEHELATLEGVLRRGEDAQIAVVAAAIRARLGRVADGSGDRAFLTDYYGALRDRLERGLLFGRRRRDKHDWAR